MNEKFGKLRSENAVKNFWNLTLRKRSKKSLKSKVENEQQKAEPNEKDIESPPPLFENEDPPISNASPIEILCRVADVKCKRDFPQFILTGLK